MLRSPWPARLANSGAFAERALSVLASAELVDYFNSPDVDIQVALLGCPYGLGLQPIERFTQVTDLHLPDHLWPAFEMVEILQRAARWDDAAAVADHIVTSIPSTPEHQARHEAAVAIAELARGEARLQAEDEIPTLPNSPAAPGRSSRRFWPGSPLLPTAARHFGRPPSPNPRQRSTELAGDLEQSAEAIHRAAAGESALPTEIAWIGLGEDPARRCPPTALGYCSAGCRYRRRTSTSGQRSARPRFSPLGRLQRRSATLSLHPIMTALSEVARITQPGEVAGLARNLASSLSRCAP